MRNDEFRNLQTHDGVTYVPGLGFIAPNQTGQTLREIRILSTVVCLALIIYFSCQKLFVMPSAFLAHLIGLNININRFTGMILASDFAMFFISFCKSLITMIISIAIVLAFCGRRYKLTVAFRMPARGTVSVALPIILGVGLMGQLLAMLFSGGFKLFGLVLTETHAVPMQNSIIATAATLLSIILMYALQELLFRGIILYSLRRYGDCFAIIISSLLFSFFQDGALEVVASFALGLALGYFTIRSGSVFTAMLGSCLFALISYGISLMQFYIEPSLGRVIMLLIYVIILVVAIFTAVFFAVHDKNAFVLKKSSTSLTLRRSIASFCSTLAFLTFVVVIILRIVARIQIIG